MKKICWGLLLIVLFTHCTKEDCGCIDPLRIDRHAACIQIYDPVCGCNQVTYGNECEARNAGLISWTYGPCKVNALLQERK